MNIKMVKAHLNYLYKINESAGGSDSKTMSKTTDVFNATQQSSQTFEGNVEFTVIGISVMHDDKESTMGISYLTDKISKNTNDDADGIISYELKKIKNSPIILGGSLFWTNNRNDFKNAGVGIWVATTDGDEVSYYFEDNSKDFNFSENSYIVLINGICVERNTLRNKLISIIF